MAHSPVASFLLLLVILLVGSIHRTQANSLRSPNQIRNQEGVDDTAEVDLRTFAGTYDPSSSKSYSSLFGFFDESREKNRQLADYEWAIAVTSGYPIISFDDSTSTSEIHFRYNHAGFLEPGVKSMQARLFQDDCITAASATALSVATTSDTTQQQFMANVDVLQATIASGSNPEYKVLSTTAAQIKFCIRIDYYWEGAADGIPVSINFLENIVTVTVDLSKGFSLTGVSMVRTDANTADESTSVTCHVQAYLCDITNTALPLDATTFRQGQILTVCVEIADVDRDLYQVKTVLNMFLEQTKSDGARKDTSNVVVAEQATALSEMNCGSGICNIQHFLESKFFDESSPGKLVVSGTAACALGPWTSPLSLYTVKVDMDLSESYLSSHDAIVHDNFDTVDACKAACTANPACQAIRAVFSTTDADYQCWLYDSYPNDSEVVGATFIGLQVILRSTTRANDR